MRIRKHGGTRRASSRSLRKSGSRSSPSKDGNRGGVAGDIGEIAADRMFSGSSRSGGSSSWGSGSGGSGGDGCLIDSLLGLFSLAVTGYLANKLRR